MRAVAEDNATPDELLSETSVQTGTVLGAGSVDAGNPTPNPSPRGRGESKSFANAIHLPGREGLGVGVCVQ